jgi:hypothetical protein
MQFVAGRCSLDLDYFVPCWATVWFAVCAHGSVVCSVFETNLNFDETNGSSFLLIKVVLLLVRLNHYTWLHFGESNVNPEQNYFEI